MQLSEPLVECLGLVQQRSDRDDADADVANDAGDDAGDGDDEDDGRALNGMFGGKPGQL